MSLLSGGGDVVRSVKRQHMHYGGNCLKSTCIRGNVPECFAGTWRTTCWPCDARVNKANIPTGLRVCLNRQHNKVFQSSISNMTS